MPGLIERYRERLPFAPEDPVVTLDEGSTPLILAPRVSERAGTEVWLKLEGANPTGSFKDRGMTCAVSAAVREGAQAVICASTGNTAASAAAYAARGGLRGRGDRARGQDRDRQARPGAHARRPGRRAARQLRPGAEARPRTRAAPPDRARQLRQRVPDRGAEDGRVRGGRGARGDRRAVHPGRQRRQHHLVLARVLRARPTAADARLPGRRRGSTRARAAGRRTPRRWPARSGSATPPGGRTR